MSRKKPGVILYGPPAAGKDTITQALVELPVTTPSSHG